MKCHLVVLFRFPDALSLKPAWIIIEKIADSAALLVSDLEHFLHRESLKLDPEECSDTLDNVFYCNLKTPIHCSNCGHLGSSHAGSQYFERIMNDEIIAFVRNHVSDMLVKLYHHLHNEALNLHNEALDEVARRRRETWRECFSILYKKQRTPGNSYKKSDSETYLVGPVGERPLHVCALLAARYKEEFKSHGSSIAEGIFEGMKLFLNQNENENEIEGLVTYGRDYCAAVGRYLNKNDDWGKLEKLKLKLPMLEDIKRWYKARCTNKGGKNWAAHEAHLKAIVMKGLYQGETLIFPFIACDHADAVRWFLDKFSSTTTVNSLG